MKKVLTMIAIMFILLSVSIISNAAVEITEEKLEETFNKILEKTEDSDDYSFHKEDDIIIIKEDEKTFGVKYELDNKPTFYTYMFFEKT